MIKRYFEFKRPNNEDIYFELKGMEIVDWHSEYGTAKDFAEAFTIGWNSGVAEMKRPDDDSPEPQQSAT